MKYKSKYEMQTIMMLSGIAKIYVREDMLNTKGLFYLNIWQKLWVNLTPLQALGSRFQKMVRSNQNDFLKVIFKLYWLLSLLLHNRQVHECWHYSDVIMSVMASQITGVSII